MPHKFGIPPMLCASNISSQTIGINAFGVGGKYAVVSGKPRIGFKTYAGLYVVRPVAARNRLW